MKKAIKLTAIALLLSGGLLAAPKPHKVVPMNNRDKIDFYTLPSQRGIDLRIRKADPGKTIVVIYDNDGNVLQKDVLTGTQIRKGYVLNQLDNGDYSIEITSNHHVFKKDIHIYDEGPIKSFIVKQS